MTPSVNIPRATIGRLPRYLSALGALPTSTDTVSSGEIGAATGFTDSSIRKDLSYLNVSGTRGLGYYVTHLQDRIRKTLGLEVERNIALVGAGNLGSALANYRGLLDAGFLLTNIFDASSQAIGTEVGGLTVQSMEELHSMEDVSIAIMAVPRRVAQSVANRLMQAGITSILNFAPKRLELPDGVISRNVDLSTELQVLAYFDQ